MKLEEIVGKYEKDKSNLIPALQEVQERLGFISEDAVSIISHHLDISKSSIYGVATFYAQFRFERPGDHNIKVCLGTACHVRGGEQLLDTLTRVLGVEPGKTTDDYKFTLERVACIGCCALAPCVVVDGEVHAKLTPSKIEKIIKEVK